MSTEIIHECISADFGKLMPTVIFNIMLDYFSIRGKLIRTLTGHSTYITKLLLYSNYIISCSNGFNIGIWDSSTYECVRVIQTPFRIKSILPHNNELICGTESGSIRIFDINTGDCLWFIAGYINDVDNLVLLENNQIAGNTCMALRIWDIDSRVCRSVFNGHTRYITGIIALPFNMIASSSLDSTIKIWDYRNTRDICNWSGHSSSITCITKISNNCIASGSLDKTIRLWHFSYISGIVLINSTIINSDSGIFNMIKSYDGRIIVSSIDGSIFVVDPYTCAKKNIVSSNNEKIIHMVQSGNQIVITSRNNGMQIYDIDTGICQNSLYGHAGPVSSIIYMNNKIISGSFDNTIKIWE